MSSRSLGYCAEGNARFVLGTFVEETGEKESEGGKAHKPSSDRCRPGGIQIFALNGRRFNNNLYYFNDLRRCSSSPLPPYRTFAFDPTKRILGSMIISQPFCPIIFPFHPPNATVLTTVGSNFLIA